MNIIFKKMSHLLKPILLPFQIGFVQGHYYIKEYQILKIKEVLNSNNNEEIVRDYEKQMALLIGTGYGISFAAGRMAFFSLLKALGIGKGDEVILPGFTCSVMPNAVWRIGATPVFADINSEDPQIIDMESAREAARMRCNWCKKDIETESIKWKNLLFCSEPCLDACRATQ